MKKLLFTVLFVAVSLLMFAQQPVPDYIKKGDEAMLRQDYPDAKMWYEEGVSFCNLYCIEQITNLWLEHTRMQVSMRSLMNKCLNCLNNMALEEDTTAIKLLEVYYREGIGTTQNEELADYWVEKLYYLRHPDQYILKQTDHFQGNSRRERERMKFFAGYAYSIQSPFGFTVGGVAKRFGWYARIKTNTSFKDYANTVFKTESSGFELNIESAEYSYEFNGKKKVNSYMATAGIVIKCSPRIFTSFGAGYGDRKLLWEYTTYNYRDLKDQETKWAKVTSASYNGFAAELDIMVKVAGPLYISAGCNTINFEFIDLNAGIGIFF